MQFDMETAIKIAKQLQEQERTPGIIKPSVTADPPSSSDNREQQSQNLRNHMLLMQDAGWLADVKMRSTAGDWQGRLTYQGHLWLETTQNEGLLKRMKDEVTRVGIPGAQTVIAEVLKMIASTVTGNTPP